MGTPGKEFIRKLASELAPEQFIPEERVDALLKSVSGGVDLSIDGDSACALLGPDLQEGEAEFQKINDHEKGDGYDNAARRATVRALRILTARCYPNGDHALPYNTSRHPVMGSN